MVVAAIPRTKIPMIIHSRHTISYSSPGFLAENRVRVGTLGARNRVKEEIVCGGLDGGILSS